MKGSTMKTTSDLVADLQSQALRAGFVGLSTFLAEEHTRLQREGSSPQGGDSERGSMRSTLSPTPQGARP